MNGLTEAPFENRLSDHGNGMPKPSVLRLNLLRAGYLLLVAGLGTQMWPQLIAEGPALELMHGVALSMLCALGLLAVLGLRYPLKMIPLLFFEMSWKLIGSCGSRCRSGRPIESTRRWPAR